MPAPEYKITITYAANGQINVEYPQDVVLSLGMIELAKNTVLANTKQTTAPVKEINGIVAAPAEALKHLPAAGNSRR